MFYTLEVIINNAAVSTTATAVKTMTRRTSSRSTYNIIIYLPAILSPASVDVAVRL